MHLRLVCSFLAGDGIRVDSGGGCKGLQILHNRQLQNTTDVGCSRHDSARCSGFLSAVWIACPKQNRSLGTTFSLGRKRLVIRRSRCPGKKLQLTMVCTPRLLLSGFSSALTPRPSLDLVKVCPNAPPVPCALFLRQSEMRVTVKHMQEKAQRELAEVTEQVGPTRPDVDSVDGRRRLLSHCFYVRRYDAANSKRCGLVQSPSWWH